MKSTIIKNIKKIILLLIVFCGFSSQKVLAQTSIGLSAIPPRLEVTVKADGSTTQTLKVRNESKEERIITVDIRDFIVTDNKGTPTIIDSVDESNNRWAASSWITVSPSTIKLKPGETKNLILTVLPPQNALPGGHYAMVIYHPEKNASLNSTGASIQANVGTLLYITIPGDIKQNAIVQKFTAPSFSEFGPIDFKSTVKNSSDIHIQPVGSITVKNWFGGKISQLALEPTNIFPYTSRDFQNTLNKKWLFGRYRADFQALYGTNGSLISATLFFWVIPWRLFILIGAAIAIIATIVILTKNQPKTKGPVDEVAELEKELETLKKKYQD
ncbi:MAG: hypothetical protein WC895_03460 [Candidatus Shapirobacteria bacterium]|jgi:hypothetical protein